MIQFTIQKDIFEPVSTITFTMFDTTITGRVSNDQIEKDEQRIFIDQSFLVWNTMLKARINAYMHCQHELTDAKHRSIYYLKELSHNIQQNPNISLSDYFRKIQESFKYFDLLIPHPESKFHKNFLPKYLQIKELFTNIHNINYILA